MKKGYLKPKRVFFLNRKGFELDASFQETLISVGYKYIRSKNIGDYLTLNKKSKIVAIILISTILGISPILEKNTVFSKVNTPISPTITSSSIVIQYDSNFTDYGFLGNGTISNPYLLESLEISNNGEWGIIIKLTTKYFKIKNCTFDTVINGIFIKSIAPGTAIFENNKFHNIETGKGIYIDNSSSCVIRNNQFNNVKIGIQNWYFSNECLIQNNTFEQVRKAILISESTNCEVTNNQAYDCDHSFLSCSWNSHNLLVEDNEIVNIDNFLSVGYSVLCNIRNNFCANISETAITVSNMEDVVIHSNTLINISNGIRLTSSSQIDIEANIIKGRNNGLTLFRSRDCFVRNNNFTNCGVSFAEVEKVDVVTWYFEDNLVNGKALGYFKHKYYYSSNFVIEGDYGQLILIRCVGVKVQNMIFENVSMGIGAFYCDETVFENCTTNNTVFGIALHGCNSCIITSCEIQNSFDGVTILETDYCSVENIECSNNTIGISIVRSEYCTVSNSTISDNLEDGIYIRYSNYCSITYNQCNKNARGLDMRQVYMPLVANNFFSSNLPNPQVTDKSGGIICIMALYLRIVSNSFEKNELGIYLTGVYNSSINKNEFKFNSYGIDMQHVTYTKVFSNLFEENDNYAIIVGVISSYNVIHHNTFINNNNGTTQAYDNGTHNLWYDEESLEGNYWSDYSGVGNYSIDGFAGAEDPYPLRKPPVDKNKNVYYAFFSLVVLIPLAVFGYFRFSSKRKSKSKI